MKAQDLIEAIQAADKEFQKRFKTPMEVFDLEFESDDEDALLIVASAKVTYAHDHSRGTRSGARPNCDVVIRFEVQDGEIVDRSIEFENVRKSKDAP